jgi:hypothetical protein
MVLQRKGRTAWCRMARRRIRKAANATMIDSSNVSQRWRNVADRLQGMVTGTPAVLLLQPTPRSLLASR